MNQFVVPLSSVSQADSNLVGNKAAVLGKLIQSGFPIPPGLCINIKAFHLALEPMKSRIDAVIKHPDLADPEEVTAASDEISQLLDELTIPQPIMTEIDQAVARYMGDGSLLAIRSSAASEDLVDASFAGQYKTALGVTMNSLQQAIIDCWCSYFNPTPMARRATMTTIGKDEGMGLIIQPMINAECAGVSFSGDPVKQNRDLILINATWGLGSGLVDGVLPADTIWMRRGRFQIEKQHIIEKRECIILDAGGGTKLIELPDENGRAACLPLSWAQRIAQFSLASEFILGRPQEVEWAISHDQVWILQSRPLTGLPPNLKKSPQFPVEWENDQDRLNMWTLTAYSEGSKIPLPLEHEEVLVEESIREDACKWMGVDHNGTLKIWNGRAYFRPLPVPLSDADKQVRQNAKENLKKRLQKEGSTSWDYWGPEIVKATERLKAFDLETADGWGLADHLENAIAVRRHHSMIHPMLWFKPEQEFFDSFAKVSGLSGEELETKGYWLIDGEETPLTRLVDDLFTLAVTAKEETAVAAILQNQRVDIVDQLAELKQAEGFKSQLDMFLSLHGDRTGNGYGSEATLLTPTWREEPIWVLRMVAKYLDADVLPPAAIRARVQKQRDDMVEAYCLACGDETAVIEFKRQLAYARKAFTVLEVHNLYIDQMSLTQLRYSVLAAARWLVNHAALNTVDEIFWLHFDEILDALRTENPESFEKIIASRKSDYQNWSKLEPPPILGTPAAELPERPPLTDHVTPIKGKRGHLVGLGASPGKQIGQARVIPDGTLPEVEPGDLLIAHNAGPLSTPWFPLIGGLVLETGSPGQHAAATAREYGIPAVIGVENATQKIKDGEIISINGTDGIVKIIS